MHKLIEIISYFRNRHLFLLDIILLPVAVYLAFALRLDSFRMDGYWSSIAVLSVLSMALFPLVFRISGVYSRYWRFASVEELLLLTGAVTVSSIIVGLVGMILAAKSPFIGPIPRSVPILFLGLALTVTAGPRILVRLSSRYPLGQNVGQAHNVLIVGAGDAGQMLAREIRKNPGQGLRLVGFIDDDPQKQGLTARGVSILGGRERIPELVERMNIEEIIIAMPSAPGAAVREIVDICKDTGITAKILPAISEILTNEITLGHVRPVELNDLLRREPIQTDLASVHKLIAGKVVLVTGAGGSIGSELCRQIVKANPDHLLLLGHGENSIFEIYNELLQEFKQGKNSLNQITPIIADVRDWPRLQQVFETHHPQVVFHAAAHKHVPLMEVNPIDAITNNVLGTYFLLETCLAHDVERFVLISTDKAVNPVNVMGVTKRMAELLVMDAARRSGRPYVAVRFGNVLGSRGSVVPFFKKQIEAGGPVTVTHPEVARYFMTIPEAVQLVLQAATMGKNGDLFMLEMGEPVRIVDLARDLIRLSGLKPDEDIKIIFTGLRPGEKLREELFQAHEIRTPTEHNKILRITVHSTHPSNLRKAMDVLYDLTRAGRVRDALSLIASLVPEYQPPRGIKPMSVDELEVSTDNMDSFIPLHARWY